MTKQKPGLELKATQERIDSVYAQLALRLNEALNNKGLKGRSLSAIAGYLGIGEAKVKGILTCSRDVPLADIITIAEKLDVSPDYLLFGAGEKKRQPQAVCAPSVYDPMFIDKADMIDMLINTVLPKLDDEEREAVMLHARLLRDR